VDCGTEEGTDDNKKKRRRQREKESDVDEMDDREARDRPSHGARRRDEARQERSNAGQHNETTFPAVYAKKRAAE